MPVGILLNFLLLLLLFCLNQFFSILLQTRFIFYKNKLFIWHDDWHDLKAINQSEDIPIF